MSTALALASVTALLKDLLENGLASAGVTAKIGGDATVSALPPDRVGSGADEKAQLNVFLYHVTPHSKMRLESAKSSNGHRPLSLELHYLLTAYGAQDYQTEILLGHALQLLHESPVLERERIRASLSALSHTRDRRVIPAPQAALAKSDLADQVDNITITPEFLSTEEISKLWSALQAKYRPSATYKVSAVFIDGVKSGRGADVPKGPAARMGDPTAHGCPLAPGPGSINVMIGGQPAWRGMTAAGAAMIAATVAAAMAAIAQAQAIATATAGTPAGPAAQANLAKTAIEQVANVANAMAGSGADNVLCPIVKVVIPDGTGVVMNGSQTVMINKFPACRVGDMIQEATAVSSVAVGCPTVMIGG